MQTLATMPEINTAIVCFVKKKFFCFMLVKALTSLQKAGGKTPAESLIFEKKLKTHIIKNNHFQNHIISIFAVCYA